MRKFLVTYLLLASIAILFAVELATGAVGNDERLAQLGALRDGGCLRGQYWRLITYAWLHASWNHVLLNSALLWWVGRIVERRLGSLATLGAYLVAVIGGGGHIALRASLHPKIGVSLGASAGVFALLGCAIVLLFRPAAARFGQRFAVRVALIAVGVVGLAASFIPGVALMGHIIGLVVGAVVGLLVRPLAAPAVPASTPVSGRE